MIESVVQLLQCTTNEHGDAHDHLASPYDHDEAFRIRTPSSVFPLQLDDDDKDDSGDRRDAVGEDDVCDQDWTRFPEKGDEGDSHKDRSAEVDAVDRDEHVDVHKGTR